MNDPIGDLCRRRVNNRTDSPLMEERFHPVRTRHSTTPVFELHSADTEIAKLGLIGEVHEVGEVAHTGLAKLMIHIERIFEPRTLAGARALAGAHDECLALPLTQAFNHLLQLPRCLDRMIRCAHAQRVSGVRAQAGGHLKYAVVGRSR